MRKGFLLATCLLVLALPALAAEADHAALWNTLDARTKSILATAYLRGYNDGCASLPLTDSLEPHDMIALAQHFPVRLAAIPALRATLMTYADFAYASETYRDMNLESVFAAAVECEHLRKGTPPGECLAQEEILRLYMTP